MTALAHSTNRQQAPRQLPLPLNLRVRRPAPAVVPVEYRQRMGWLREMVNVRAWRWQSADIDRLHTLISGMLYGDAIRCLNWRLERESLAGSYAQFILYYRDVLVGVVDVRGYDMRPLRWTMARYLAAMGWRSAWCVVEEGSALSDEGTNTREAKRLFK